MAASTTTDSTPGMITLGDGLIKINTIPSKGFIKFRKQFLAFIQIGANWEFHHKAPLQTPNGTKQKQYAKVVLKPITSNSKRNWRVEYEPGEHEVSFLLKQQFPITNSLNVQIGFGANIKDRTITWKGKFSSPKDLHSGVDNVSLIRDKRSIGLFPGADLRLWWSANYVLPEISGNVFRSLIAAGFYSYFFIFLRLTGKETSILTGF
ncbi:hypothetical protein ACFE04_017660 [Oxalis oulophora]